MFLATAVWVNPLVWAAVLAALLLGVLVAWWFAAQRAQSLVSKAHGQARHIVEQAKKRAAVESQAIFDESERQTKRRIAAWDEDEAQRKRRLEELEADADKRHRRLVERDRALARRDQIIGGREQALEKKTLEVQEEAEEVRRRQEMAFARLEEVSGLTRDEAQNRIIEELRQEARQSAAAMVREVKEEAQKQADRDAQKIIALAIERLASDYSAERTVSWVKISGSAMRGRIIGAEGRNIRCFENLTGMQLVLDDNPEQVGISGFNPIRREIARRSLEKLVDGGAIHPRKIQQVVTQQRKKVEQEMLRAGREAVREFKLRDVHPEIVAHLGRLRYRTSYGQNVLEHVKEAARICGIMAAELGMDQKLAQRAGLLHDIGKAVDFEREGTHPEIGGELGRKFGEPEVVINAIESHHEDCEVIHPISVLVAAADALSGARPGARRRTTTDYVKRVTKLEEMGQSFEGVDKCYALQAGREVRVIVTSQKISDDKASLLAHDMAERIQSEVDYPGRIKITVIRQVRSQAVAR